MKGEPSQNVRANITISTKAEFLQQLKEEADERGQSLNIRINEVLSSYLTFYRHSEYHSSAIIPSEIFAMMIKWLDETKLQQILAHLMDGVWPSFFAKEQIPYSLENLITYGFKNVAHRSGLYSSVKFYEDDNWKVLLFEHKLDIRWSRALAEVFSSCIRKNFHLHLETKVLPTTVILKIKKR